MLEASPITSALLLARQSEVYVARDRPLIDPVTLYPSAVAWTSGEHIRTPQEAEACAVWHRFDDAHVTPLSGDCGVYVRSSQMLAEGA